MPGVAIGCFVFCEIWEVFSHYIPKYFFHFHGLLFRGFDDVNFRYFSIKYGKNKHIFSDVLKAYHCHMINLIHPQSWCFLLSLTAWVGCQLWCWFLLTGAWGPPGAPAASAPFAWTLLSLSFIRYLVGAPKPSYTEERRSTFRIWHLYHHVVSASQTRLLPEGCSAAFKVPVRLQGPKTWSGGGSSAPHSSISPVASTHPVIRDHYP